MGRAHGLGHQVPLRPRPCCGPPSHSGWTPCGKAGRRTSGLNAPRTDPTPLGASVASSVKEGQELGLDGCCNHEPVSGCRVLRERRVNISSHPNNPTNKCLQSGVARGPSGPLLCPSAVLGSSDAAAGKTDRRPCPWARRTAHQVGGENRPTMH